MTNKKKDTKKRIKFSVEYRMIYTRVKAEKGVNVKQFWDTGHDIKLKRNKFHFNLWHTFLSFFSKFYASVGTANLKKKTNFFCCFKRRPFFFE